MDSQILFSHRREEYLDSITYLPPASGTLRRYEVVEVRYGMSDQDAVPRLKLIPETELERWFNEKLDTQSVSGDVPSKGESKFLLGPTRSSRENGMSKTLPYLDCYGSDTLPFSHASFVTMLNRMRLPDATLGMLKSNSSHFQRYTMGRTDQKMQDIGVTMRLASRGVLEFDISASISYQPNTGAVNALLHGCTSYQQDQIGKQLQYLCVLARHPLLLPTILAEMRLNSIKDLADKMWRFLLYVETRSGQTGAPALNAHKHQKSGESMNWAKLAVDALAVMQIAAAMEDHANGLQVSIGEMRKMLDDLGRAAQLILFLPPP